MARLVTSNELRDIFKVTLRTIIRWQKEDWFPKTKTRPGVPTLYDLSAVKDAAASVGLWDEVVDMPVARHGGGRRPDPDKHSYWKRTNHGPECEGCREATRLHNQQQKQRRRQLNSKETAA